MLHFGGVILLPFTVNFCSTSVCALPKNIAQGHSKNLNFNALNLSISMTIETTPVRDSVRSVQPPKWDTHEGKPGLWGIFIFGMFLGPNISKSLMDI
jgi:hypothetical protein